jgi:solute:Na+ symporter, SSS family
MFPLPGWICDAVAIAGYFALILTIGLWPRKQGTLEQFSLGGREMPWWAVTASILAAEISAATFLGGPEEGFSKRNFTYAQLAIGTVLARAIVAYLFIKPYYQYNVVSIYEFLHIRFGNATKNAASFIFLLTRLLASGTRLYVAGVIVVFGIEYFTGIKPTPYQEIYIYIGVLASLAVLTTVYTAIGGIKAVVWTDFIQATLMFSALGYAMWSLLQAIPGGWSGALTYLQGSGDLHFWNTGLTEGPVWHQVRSILEEPYTIWSALIGSTFITMATHGTDQDMVQRMLTAKDYHRSRLAVICSGLIDIPVVMLVLTVGILLYVFYQTHADPNLPGKNIFAYWIIHQVPPGFRGLMVAGVLSTAMGSLSTALNALATSFVKDWWMPYLGNSAAGDEKSHVRAVRWSTVGFAILLVAVGGLTARAVVIYPSARIIPIVLGVFGYTYGSLLGIFLVGLMTRTRGSDRGNLVAMVAGFVVVAILSGLPNDIYYALTGRLFPMPDWLPVIEFPWRVFFGAVTTMSVALCYKTPSISKHDATS